MNADVVGGITPVVLVTLSSGEKILSEHGLMMYKEKDVQVHRRTLKSLGVSTLRILSVESKEGSEEEMFLAEYEGPGHVTFSRDKGGEVRIVQLQPGQTMRLRSGHVICFDETVKYNPVVLARYPDPADPKKTMYIVADELTGPGTVVFQSNGNIVTFNLNQGEGLRTSTDALLSAEPSVSLKVNWIRTTQSATFTGNINFPVLDVFGPGQVLLHSGV